MNMRLTTAARAACAAFALLVTPAGANDAGPLAKVNALPHALKDIPQATGACRDERKLEFGAPAGADAKPDLSCGVAVNAVQGLLQRPDAVMIDVRAVADYEAYHIGGAIQASLADLRNKPYWRGKTVVLVGNGKAETELYATCSHLKKSYKQVHVVRGGMPAWLAAGQPVSGRAPSPQQLVRLSAAELWLESQQRDNLVLIAKEQSAMQAELPLAMVLAETSPAGIRAVVERRARALKNEGLASVVLALPADFPNEKLASFQQALAPLPLLVYAHTRDAFRTQQRVQKAMWLAQENGPKQLGCGL